MEKQIYPIVTTYGFPTKKGFTFIFLGNEIKFEGADLLISEILPYCNGFNTKDRIIKVISSSENKKNLVEMM